MSANANSYVITPPSQAAIAVAGTDKMFPVRRIWCVGRNYIEHIREMGQDERAPPFFFAKPADALVPDGSTVPYPPLTKDLHFEIELVVALKRGGRNLAPERTLDLIYGYGVGIDLTRATCRSPRAISSARGKSARRSTRPRPAARCGRPPRSVTRRRAGSISRSTARCGRTAISSR